MYHLHSFVLRAATVVLMTHALIDGFNVNQNKTVSALHADDATIYLLCSESRYSSRCVIWVLLLQYENTKDPRNALAIY